MNGTKLRINASFLYLFLMSLAGAYWLISTGTIGVVAGLVHVLLGSMILIWYTKSVLVRDITDTTSQP